MAFDYLVSRPYNSAYISRSERIHSLYGCGHNIALISQCKNNKEPERHIRQIYASCLNSTFFALVSNPALCNISQSCPDSCRRCKSSAPPIGCDSNITLGKVACLVRRKRSILIRSWSAIYCVARTRIGDGGSGKGQTGAIEIAREGTNSVDLLLLSAAPARGCRIL
jgi:hypothetical protein